MKLRSSTKAFHLLPSIMALLAAKASSLLISGWSAKRYGIMRYS